MPKNPLQNYCNRIDFLLLHIRIQRLCLLTAADSFLTLSPSGYQTLPEKQTQTPSASGSNALPGAVKFAMAAALCMHWFNPLVWLMACLLNRDVEPACGEGVLHRFGKQAQYVFYQVADFVCRMLYLEKRNSTGE